MSHQGGKSSGGQSQGGDYQKYMDYSQYMSQGDDKKKSDGRQGHAELAGDAPINLISTGSYHSKYVPDVKKWSNREEVNDAFLKMYAAPQAKDASDDYSDNSKKYYSEY